MRIPDITERFPEGMDGIDLTERLMGEPSIDYDYRDHYYEDNMEIPYCFSVGNTYHHTSWFTGGVMEYEVSEIKDCKITFKVIDYECDGIHERSETYDLKVDDDGNEYVVLFTYAEHDCVLTAKGDE